MAMRDPIVVGVSVDQPDQVGIVGEVGHESPPRAPAEQWPSHHRPGCCLPLPCSIAAQQERRVAVVVDDEGMTAVGVNRPVRLDACGEDVPGQLIGAPAGTASCHGPPTS